MLSLADHQLARDLAIHRAVIIKESPADAYPAYAFGDRRKRPLRWVSDESFRNLSSFGGLEASKHGYGVTESFLRRHILSLEARGQQRQKERFLRSCQ